MAIGEAIEYWMFMRRLNRQTLAELVGVSEPTLHRYITNENPPPEPNLRRLAAALGVTVEILRQGRPRIDVLPPYKENPRPVRYGGIKADNVYVMYQTANTPLDFNIRYIHEHISLHPALAKHYQRLEDEMQLRVCPQFS
jgi:transcriptional regulator with XRE-family HTH domain